MITLAEMEKRMTEAKAKGKELFSHDDGEAYYSGYLSGALKAQVSNANYEIDQLKERIKELEYKLDEVTTTIRQPQEQTDDYIIREGL